jgi:hypothetical protein
LSDPTFTRLSLTHRMTNSQRLSAVRRRLLQWLHEPSCSEDGDPRLPNPQSPSGHGAAIRSESILIRDGFYCGHKFDVGDVHAVWFIEEDELKIFSADGRWLASLVGSQIDDQRGDADDSTSGRTDLPGVVRFGHAVDESNRNSSSRSPDAVVDVDRPDGDDLRRAA